MPRHHPIEGYANAAPSLLTKYEAISSAELYKHLPNFPPSAISSILDIGAGTGRDAAWLASLGHHVVAVEPVAPFRAAAIQKHENSNVKWVNDRLPDLHVVSSLHQTYDCILMSGVWQHLQMQEQEIAMPKLAELLTDIGTIIISLRHGPGAVDRQCYETEPKKLIVLAENVGLQVCNYQSRPSMQASNRSLGVTWTWLSFKRSNAGAQQ